MNFIKLTYDSGGTVYVNADNITQIGKENNETWITFNFKGNTGVSYIKVKESPEEIMKILGNNE